MSLLLQALQKAAKSREDGDSPAAADAPIGDELELEPIQSEPTFSDELDARPAATSTAARAQAATVMQAGRGTPGFDPLDYAREHYMLTLIALAVLFGIGYGGYVYIQVAQPFGGATPPVPVVSAPPAPPAVAAAPSAPAKISGMPAADPTPAPAAAQPAAMATEKVAASALAVADTREPETTSAPRSGVEAGARDAAPSAGTPNASAARSRPKRQARRAGDAMTKPAEALVDASDSVETVVIQPSRAQSGIAVRRDPQTATPVSPTLLQAYAALQNGEDARARALYQEVLQAEPRNIDALLGLGAIAWKEGRADEASQHYQRVLELDPRNTYAQAGLIAIVGGADPQASESRLKQLIARDPSAFLHFTLGNLYAEQGQWPAAQQAYFQAYQLQQDNPDYAFNLAVALEHMGQNRLALDYYRKALDLSFRAGRANFDQNLVIQRVGLLSTRVEQ